MPRILLTGSSGYIGSIVLAHLSKNPEYQIWALDRLLPHRALRASNVEYVYLDLKEKKELDTFFLTHGPFDCVLHLAASIKVEESQKLPYLYIQNNIGSLTNLLEVAREHGCRKLVFASTAAVYDGTLETETYSETDRLLSTNVYAATKQYNEEQIHASGIDYVIFRFFNVSGADLEHEAGYRHREPSHLIDRCFQRRLENKPVEVFGTDYPTPDGTCVRDYLHPIDIARAFELVVPSLLDSSNKNKTYNLGNQKGYSVKEIVETMDRLFGAHPVVYRERRSGDQVRSVASTEAIQSELGWEPIHGLESILKSAYEFRKKMME